MGVFQRAAVRRTCLYGYREMLRRTSRDEAPAKDKTSHSEEPTLDSRRRISPLD